MNQQPDLFSVPQTHVDDPATSHRAETKVRRKGLCKRRCEAIERALRAEPGLTTPDLAARLNGLIWPTGDHSRRCEIAKRCSQLKGAGRARRECSRGDEFSRWFVVEDLRP